MTFLEALIGLQGVWQLETVGSALARMTVLVAVAATGAAALGRHGGASHHIVWRTTLVLSLVIGTLAPVLPGRAIAVAAPEFTVRADNGVYLAGLRAAAARYVGAAPESGARFSAPVKTGVRGPGVFGWLVALWLAGSLTLLARLAVGALRLAQYRRAAETTLPTRVQRVVDRLMGELAVRCTPTVGITDRFTLPVTFGVVRPTILLPRDIGTWPDERVELVMRHELAHVHRRDWAWQVVARLACAAYWFNPLVWLAERRQRIAAEVACDRRAVEGGGNAIEFASELIRLSTERLASRSPTEAHAMAFSRSTDLEHRVRALLAGSVGRTAPRTAPRRGLVFVCVGLTLVAAPLLAFRPTLGPCVDATVDSTVARPTTHTTPND